MDVKLIKYSNNVEFPVFNTDNTEWFVKYGDKNDLIDSLLKSYTEVGLHRAIIQKKVNMAMGGGIIYTPTDEKVDTKTEAFLNNVNPRMTMEELVEKIKLDMFLFGGSYLQIIWSKNGKKISQIYHMPYAKMRSGVADKNGVVNKYYYNPSDNKYDKWTNYTNIGDVVEFPVFDTERLKTKAQILFIKKDDPSNRYYPMPDYIGCLKDLDTFSAINDFNNKSIHNGMNPGMLIVYKGDPSPEEQDDIVEQMVDKYGDTANGNKSMIIFAGEKEDVKIEPMASNDIADLYIALAADVKENIVISHQITRAVIGLSTPGALGSTKEIVDGMEMVMGSYIAPYQNFVLNKLNQLMSINGLNTIQIKETNTTISKYTIGELKDFLTVDEIRELLGYEAVEVIVKDDIVDDEVINTDNDTIIEE